MLPLMQNNGIDSEINGNNQNYYLTLSHTKINKVEVLLVL